MSQTIDDVTSAAPAYQKLRLVTAHGPVYRAVSSNPPRDALPEEIPVIDVSPMYGSFNSRAKLAASIRVACENYGFFYVRNHGISKEKIGKARQEALRFFRQPQKLKEQASQHHSRFSNGWSGLRTRQVNPTETPGRSSVQLFLRGRATDVILKTEKKDSSGAMIRSTTQNSKTSLLYLRKSRSLFMPKTSSGTPQRICLDFVKQ